MTGDACAVTESGIHVWGDWSRPYADPDHDGAIWQERRCQCGDRDRRPAPDDERRPPR